MTALFFLTVIVSLSYTVYSSELYHEHTQLDTPPPSLPILFKSTRLHFREFTLDDTFALKPILGDPEVMEYKLSYEDLKKTFHALRVQEIDQFLQRVITSYHEQGFGRYAIIKNDDHTLIGYCGFKQQQLDDGNCYVELGYRLGKKYWGNGYATEAAKATTAYAQKLGITSLISIIDPSNEASIKVIQKTGFTFWKVENFLSYPFNIYTIKTPSYALTNTTVLEKK